MGPLPFSEPLIPWSALGISTERTLRWPFLLALVATAILTFAACAADAYASTASVNGTTCPIRSAAYTATRDLRIDCATPYWVCPAASASYSSTLVLELHSVCSNDRVSASGFEP